MVATAPDWSDCVNDVLCAKLIACCDSRLSSRTSTQISHRDGEFRASCSVDSAIDTTARDERFIRGINYGVSVDLRDISVNCTKVQAARPRVAASRVKCRHASMA
jgi:hypothetical protein